MAKKLTPPPPPEGGNRQLPEDPETDRPVDETEEENEEGD